MSDHLLFSIIIPTYNRASFIEKTISSALNQQYQNLEVIVVDDGSTDATEEIVKALNSEKVRYYKIQNAERGHARNYGMQKSKGDYVTFLDSDDLLLPAYLSNALESIIHYQQPPFLHLAYEIVQPDNSLLFKVDNLKNDDIHFLTKGNSLSCAGCFMRADVSKKFLFNEDRNLAGSEDWELWFRVLANHGIKTDNRISSRMINHENRSVSMSLGEEEKLVLRKELALKYAFMDQMVRERFKTLYKKTDAFGDSYIALHLALLGHTKRSAYYLFKFLSGYPFAIFSTRFFVIVKYIVLKSFHFK